MQERSQPSEPVCLCSWVLTDRVVFILDQFSVPLRRDGKALSKVVSEPDPIALPA